MWINKIGVVISLIYIFTHCNSVGFTLAQNICTLNIILTLSISNALTRTNIQSDTKKGELLKNPTKIEEIQEKKFIDRN